MVGYVTKEHISYLIRVQSGASYLIARSQSTPLAIEVFSPTASDVHHSELPEDILTNDDLALLDPDSWDENVTLTYSPSSESDGFSNTSRRNSCFPFSDLPTLEEEAFPPTWNWTGRKSPFRLLDPKHASRSAFSTRSNSNSSAVSSGSVFSSLSAHGVLEMPARSDGTSRRSSMADSAGQSNVDLEAARPFVCDICQNSFVSNHAYTGIVQYRSSSECLTIFFRSHESSQCVT
jgi:hypothetical protein